MAALGLHRVALQVKWPCPGLVSEQAQESQKSLKLNNKNVLK